MLCCDIGESSGVDMFVNVVSSLLLFESLCFMYVGCDIDCLS